MIRLLSRRTEYRLGKFGVGIFGAFLLSLVLWAASQPRHPPNDNRTAAGAQGEAGISGPALRNQGSSDTGKNEPGEHEQEPRLFGLPIGSVADVAGAFITFVAVCVAVRTLSKLERQTDAAVTTARESVKANTLSRDALIAEQRPWISMTVQIGPFDRDMDPRLTRHDWHVPVHITLHNHGKTPAMDVQVMPKLVPRLMDSFTGGINEQGLPQGQIIPGTNVRQEVERACSTIEKRIRDQMKKAGASFGFGEVIFPDGDESMTIRVPFPGEEVPVPDTFFGHFILAVGVSYNSTFNGHEDFKTGRAFAIWKNTGDERLRFSGEGLPVDAIGFIPEPWGTGHLTT